MSRPLLIHNIGLLATPTGQQPLGGGAMEHVQTLPDASVLIEEGRIRAVCSHGELPDAPEGTTRYDARGMIATPGLIDAHTHLVFGGYRQGEAQLRAQGAHYMDILRAGGGILDTVRKTRKASFDALYAKAEGFAREMLARGVTACEVKSGYGLDMDTERKQLRVARALGERTPLEVATTFLGAHAVAPEFAGAPDAYVDFLVREAIPTIAAEGLADFCDVFCEEGVFDIAQSRRILQCAAAHGMVGKLHADELVPMGGGGLAAEMGAVSADHLIAASGESLAKMARAGTIAVLLPQTSLYLGKPFAPAGRMMALAVPIALATDFNPGSCPSNNLHLSMTLAFLKYGMTPQAVLTAVTQNAACAIGRGDTLGTLEAGKQGDLVLWDAGDLAMLCYRMGSNLACTVVKRGEIICENIV